MFVFSKSCVHTASLSEIKIKQVLLTHTKLTPSSISYLETAVHRCSVEKVLRKISKNSPQNTSDGDWLLNKKRPPKLLSCQFYQAFWSNCFTGHVSVTVSLY